MVGVFSSFLILLIIFQSELLFPDQVHPYDRHQLCARLGGPAPHDCDYGVLLVHVGAAAPGIVTRDGNY
jgi:hypothetical protein